MAETDTSSEPGKPDPVAAPVPPSRPSIKARLSELRLFHAEFWRTLRVEVLPWIPLLISLIAISLSLYTFFSVRATPDMLVILPRQIRIVQSGVQPAWIYLEPTFLHAGTSERVEAVTDLHLSLEAANRPSAFIDFVWNESGTWHYEASAQELDWRFSDDPGPFLVSPRNAAQFTALFQGPPGWRFEPGLYRITLHVTRLNNQNALAAYADVRIDETAIEYLNEFSGSRFLTFPFASSHSPHNSTNWPELHD